MDDLPRCNFVDDNLLELLDARDVFLSHLRPRLPHITPRVGNVGFVTHFVVVPTHLTHALSSIEFKGN